MATFIARWADTCETCDVPIEKGDEVTYISDGMRSGGRKELAHVHCPVRVDDTPAKVCGECHMALPLSGVCGECDDA